MSVPPESTSSPQSTSYAAPAGVIHDIGYRRYDGPRLGRGYILRSLFVQSLRSTYGLGRTARAKILPFLLGGVMLLPAAIIVAVTVAIKPPEPPVAYTRYFVYTQAVIAIFAAAQAPQLFSRDLRFRTITLYFSRPLVRIDYVVAKYAALVASLFILMAVPLVVMYAGALLGKYPFGAQTKGLLAGLAGVAVLALVLAGIAGVISALTTRRGFGVAAIITVLTVTYGGASFMSAILGDQGHRTAAGYAGLFSPITLVDGVQVVALGATSASPAPPPAGGLGALLYVLVTVLVVGGSFGLLMLRYRKVAAS
ncbi:ABC transporter permease [Actinopolymorpha rutila]|uniref:ABC-2 type transport system permease protein n=1 Tax=Actinopolymorpha rutila TaxID=446787 RepID=A0A852ZNF3_9ACTN|nr:ABC transporter permease subunit [Actinopolymorpha rutila]NYH90999.1 ABC-2 type transport system permease protein [Actinopolymorpha rutila]